MLLPVLAGLGALSLLSNPPRKRRRKMKRNPDSDALAASKIIHQQIGGRAFFMMGAKQFTGGVMSGRPGLSFRVGRNAKGINHIVVYLEPDDTYTVAFAKSRGTSYKVIQTVKDVYADNLHGVLSAGTGMVLSLGTMRNPQRKKSDQKAIDWRIEKIKGTAHQLDMAGKAFGMDLSRKDHIDTHAAGDYGADPVGDGMFRMVPSGDIVDYQERSRRLSKKSNPRRRRKE